MDEKMKKAIEELTAKLSDEQKEKAKNCKTLDELIDFVGNEGIELPDDLLDSVSGGVRIEFTPVELIYDDSSKKR